MIAGIERCFFFSSRTLGLMLAALASLALSPELARAQTPAEHFSAYTAGSTVTVDHSAWSRLLERYVVAESDGINRVRYASMKKGARADLEGYLARLVRVDVKALDRNEQFAYWANLYNAKTIAIVLDALPVRSIKDINLGGGLLAAVTGGPWKAQVLKVAGVDLSLDDIEHGILRPVFKDPRVHYAVNCASLGCPNLGRAAFTGAKLDAELDAAATAFINHPRGLRISDGEAVLSSIYSWFEEDFGGSAAAVLAHVSRYAGEALKSKLQGISEIADYGYDWSLNDAGP
jgi:hypothetical protein